jgi:transmembrane sensor
MTRIEDPIRRAVVERAGDWHVTNQSASVDHAERADFVAWMKSSPLHVEEYLRVALVARDLRAALDYPINSLEALIEEAREDVASGIESWQQTASLTEQPIRRATTLSRWPTIAIAATVVVAVVAMFWWATGARVIVAPVAYETARGEQREWQLADGSRLHLNTDSFVTVRYSRDERLVEIARGQVHFQVAHDAKRRFRVAAGVAGVIATGTQFDIYRKATAAVVTVTEGQVAIFTGDPPAPTQLDAAPRVNAGYQLRVDGGVISAQPVPVDPELVLAWLRHKVAFKHRPLGEVADEFNRYGHVPLAIADPTLRALRISGVFDADDVDSFVASLETFDGVRVERTPTQIRVFRVVPPEP